MANDSKKLEERLLELGKGLASPPSSADEIYLLLDAIDGLLSSVEQSPLPSMLEALQPVMKALVVKEFLRHSDMDVKVAVASCISEITRITAPEAPYDDDIMKEIFQMIVEAFEGLDDTSSRSFQKRVSILETVAKVRSCVVMLDLECDALILQMFHHFLKTIRIDHSENVFSSMDTIMTLVIDESEDISSELLSALLDTLKKDNKDVLPIAEKLAAKVMGTCASKLKPYLAELVLSTGASLSEYNNIVASICQDSSGGALDHDEAHVSHDALADDSKLSERTVSDELPQVSAKLEQEVGCPEKVGTAAETLPTAATSNGDVQMGNGDTMEQPSSPKQKSERSRRSGQSKNVASDGNDIVNVESIAVKPDGTADLRKAKGRTTNSSAQLTDYIDRIDSDKDAPVVTSRRKVPSKEPEDADVEAPTGLTSDSEVKPRRNTGKRGRFKRNVVERESSGRKVPSKEGESASAHEAESTSAQEGETAVSSEPEKNNELQHLLGPDGPTSDSQPSPISSPPNPSRAKKGRPPWPKGAADRSDVYAASGTLASASVQNDPAENSQAHNKVMPSKDDDSKEPEDADDVEAPTGLTSDLEVKPRRNTGKRGRFKRKVVERESSGRKVPSKEGKAASAHEAQEGKTAVSSEPEKNNKLQHLLGSDGLTSDSQPSPISSPPNPSRAKRGRPPGPKGAAEHSDVYAAAGTLASTSVQNDHAENSQAHNKVMPSKDDDSKEPEDADDVEAPTGLTSDSEVKQRRNTGKRGQFKRKVVEREFSGRKQSSNTKQQKEEETHDKDVDGEPSLKEMASSPGSASKAPSVDCTCLDNNVKTKRRKLALETEEISETLDHKKQLDEHLVGSKIEVWWPDDKMFYKGIVDSYDPVTKNHKIVYTDGDVEVLLLKNELWEFAESDSENAGSKRKAGGSASQTPHNKKAKGSSNTPSKQAKSQAQSKSGTETSSRDVPRPRGRPRSGTSDVGKLAYDDAPGNSQKSKGKSVSNDKEKTPRSSGKKLEGPENEPEDGNPRTSSKREESGNKSKNLASKPGSAAKGDTTKNAGKLKGEPSKSGRKSRNETLKASTNLKNDTLKCSSKSADDTGKSKDSTPRTASRAETDEDGKKKTLRTKPKTDSTPKTGGDSKANDISSKGKTKVGECESAAPVSDGEATTGGRKRRRRGRK